MCFRHQGDGVKPCCPGGPEVKGWVTGDKGVLRGNRHLHAHVTQKRLSTQGSRRCLQNLKEQTDLCMDHMEISQAALLVLKLHPKKQVIKQESTEVCLRVLFKGQIPLPHFHPQTQVCSQANPLRDGLVTIKQPPQTYFLSRNCPVIRTVGHYLKR